MRTAPPVDYPVARSGFWHRALMALCGLAGACAGLSWAQWFNQPAWPAVTLVTALAVGAYRYGYRIQAQSPMLHLRWNGQTWLLWADGHTTIPVAHLDLIHDMDAAALLRGRDAHGRVLGWWPVCRRDAPHDWHRLRLALYDAQRLPSAPSALQA